MFIETRYYDDGTAIAMMYDAKPFMPVVKEYDAYLDEYEKVDDWIGELEVELDDVVELVLSLNDGEWVDITPYI